MRNTISKHTTISEYVKSGGYKNKLELKNYIEQETQQTSNIIREIVKNLYTIDNVNEE